MIRNIHQHFIYTVGEMFAFFCILLLSQCLAVCLSWLEICDPLASASGVLDYSSPCLVLFYTF